MVVGKREQERIRYLRRKGLSYREIRDRVNRSLKTIYKYSHDVIPANSVKDYEQKIRTHKQTIKKLEKELEARPTIQQLEEVKNELKKCRETLKTEKKKAQKRAEELQARIIELKKEVNRIYKLRYGVKRYKDLSNKKRENTEI